MSDSRLSHGAIAAGKYFLSGWREPLWACAFALLLVWGFEVIR
jgi:hypothetical protein